MTRQIDARRSSRIDGDAHETEVPETEPVGADVKDVALGADAVGELKRWLDHTPEEWGFRDHNMTSPVRGAALPMGFNRKPHYANGLLLVGDAGGMVNPFNGEGIAYAMESGVMAADVITQALSRITNVLPGADDEKKP